MTLHPPLVARLILIASLALCPCARAATPATTRASTEPTLHVGDRAPALNVDRWLKGEPVTAFVPGTIYVVECWATWCGPCVDAMPELTWLQKRYPHVVFVGVDVMEDDPSRVEPFVRRMGDRLGYRIAADVSPGETKGGPMWDAWMAASGMGGIPCSFLIDGEGRIAAITHPLSLRTPLALLVAGKPLPPRWTREEEDAERATSDAYGAAFKAKDWGTAGRLLDALEAGWSRHGDEPEGYDAQRQALRIASGDFAVAHAALEAFDRLVESTDDVEPSLRTRADSDRISLAAAERDVAALNRAARDAARRQAGDAQHLNAIAWNLIGDPVGTGDHLVGIDLDLVLKIAADANDAAAGTDDNILDTLARVRALRGEFAEATTLEERAIAICRNERARTSFVATLADYRAGHVQ